jgi:rubrerythrin
MSEKEKAKALGLMGDQLKTEEQLVELYEKTAGLIVGEPARWLLHMLQMDSRKHIEIFRMAIEILEGREVSGEDRMEIATGLKKHMELEKASIERGEELRRNPWVRDNSGLSRLLEVWSRDEMEHHRSLQRLKDDGFTRENALDAYTNYRRNAFEMLRRELANLGGKGGS